MNDQQWPRPPKTTPTSDLSATVGKKAGRKLKARHNKDKNIWFGFGVLGLIGWSVARPCLLGAVLGWWLDSNYPRGQSWTLALILAGLTIGCFNAWRWLEIERKKIARTEDERDDDNT